MRRHSVLLTENSKKVGWAFFGKVDYFR